MTTDLTRYLQRIAYDGPTERTAETLSRLHRAHMLAVPFENLSIHAGETIILDDSALYGKIVERRRGGFCYELNGLFAFLLRALGFDVVKLSAGVASKDGEFDPDFDHMALMVRLEERWLADVGFGDSFLSPLRLDYRGEQSQDGDVYRIEEDADRLILLRREDEEWKPQYRFSLTPYEYADFEPMCRYHQTSPLSPFTQKRVCTRPTPQGRITLSELRLITTSNGNQYERELASEEEFSNLLREHFGIDIAGFKR
ncbi:MAG: arylamine N-acetyltransferase [Acidobacteriota bacterium]